jgi:hypothetical protein
MKTTKLVRVKASTHKKLKVLAAEQGESIIDMVDKLITHFTSTGGEVIDKKK